MKHEAIVKMDGNFKRTLLLLNPFKVFFFNSTIYDLFPRRKVFFIEYELLHFCFVINTLLFLRT